MLSTPPLSLQKERLFLYGGAAVLCAVVCVGALVAMLHLRDGALAQMQNATRNLATSIGQTLDGTIDALDVALLGAADEIGQQQASGRPNAQRINRYLETLSRRVPNVAFMRVTDALGTVIYGIDPAVGNTTMADRELYTRLRDDPLQGLVMAKPVISKVSGKAVLPFSRPILGPDGGLAGVVYAGIYVSDLGSLLGKIEMDPGGSIALRDRDMGLIVRQTNGAPDPISMGSTQLSKPFTEALRADPKSGSFVSDASSIDSLVRLYSYARSLKHGYTVVVGLPLEARMHTWWLQLVTVCVLLACFVAALFALVRQVLRGRAGLEASVRKLAESERQQRQLLQRLHTAVVVHAADTHILFSNDAACKLLGLSRDQMEGKTALDPAWCFVDEAQQTLTPDQYPVSVVVRTQQPLEVLILGVKAPGRSGITWLQGSAFPEFDNRGQLQQVVVNFVDISKRRESEERWRFAIEGSGDGIWDIDLQTRRAICSRRYYEMLGFDEGDVAADWSQWAQMVHPHDLERVRREIAEHTAKPGGSFSTEYRLRCKDGSYKWIHARGMVVGRDADGEPLRMVGTHTDISAMKAAELQIWSEANFDPLTGLPNRRLFYDRLEMELRQAQRDTSILALLFIDLDHFKEVNDTLGHDVGDQLLVEAANRIKEAVRDCDTVARLGGDEFTVVLTQQQRSFDIGAVAQKIIDQLSRPFLLGHSESFVSASVGIALFPDDAIALAELMKNADQAMYAAKAAGRKCFRFFTKVMQESAVTRMGLAKDLRHALEDQQFELYYQPVVELATGRTGKAEALLRWHHPQRGIVPPSEFIPIAEEIGAIHAIGDWVFQQSLHKLIEWRRRIDPHFQISINKSPVQFSADAHQRGHGHPAWIPQMQAMGVSGNGIVIEITEGVLMDSNEQVANCLLAFRDAGIQVAIDDFGTGYSSLAYLTKFDIDYLKIDQSFTRKLAPDSPDFALCEAIIAMAHKLGLKVIAEGIETEQQRTLLQQIGCDFGQGYLFSRPLNAAAFEAYLEAF